MGTLEVWLECEGLDRDAFRIIEVHGEEALSRPYEVRCKLVSVPGAALDDLEILGTPAALVIRETAGEHRIHGLVMGVSSSVHSETGGLAWDLVIKPRLATLGLTTSTEVVQDLSSLEIAAERLRESGLKEGTDYKITTGASYSKREFVIQYRESDLAFVMRLLEHEGVSFFFRQDGEREVLVLCDENASFPMGSPEGVPFRPRGERQGAFSMTAETQPVPARVQLRDYNYRTPTVRVQAEATVQGALGASYEYGNHTKTPEEAQRLATVRAQELAWPRKLYRVRTVSPSLLPGTRFKLEDHPLGDLELLVVQRRFKVRQADWSGHSQAEGDGFGYENELIAIAADVPFRPERKTAKPIVPGVISGVVEAEQEGEYAELDDEGRYHVRFMFDRSDRGRGKASRPIRMAQPHAGPGYGFHFPLRDGVEVVLSCVEGDPDRPIISGAVANPTTPTTVAEKNATRNVIRTGGGTEINIDDTHGSERLKITVPFGETLLQLGAPNDPTPGAALKTSQNIALASGAGMSLDDKVEIRGHAPRIDFRADNNATLSSGTQTAIASDAETLITAPLVDRRANINVTTSFALHSSISHGIAVLQGASSVSVGSDGIVVVSAPTVVLRADVVRVVGSAAVDVTAPAVSINGSANVNIAGGEVLVTGSVIKLNA